MSILILQYIKFFDIEKDTSSFIEECLTKLRLSKQKTKLVMTFLRIFVMVAYLEHLLICAYIRFIHHHAIEPISVMERYVTLFYVFMYTELTIGYEFRPEPGSRCC